MCAMSMLTILTNIITYYSGGPQHVGNGPDEVDELMLSNIGIEYDIVISCLSVKRTILF